MAQHISAADAQIRLYIGGSARLTAEVPASWGVPASGIVDLAGVDGWVSSSPLPGNTLTDACSASSRAAAYIIDADVTVEQSSCLVTGTYDGNDARAEVFTLPAAFDWFDETISYVVAADPRTSTRSFPRSISQNRE